MSEEKKVIKIILPPKFETYEVKNEKTQKVEYWWKIKAFNGNIIAASSEGYVNRADCIKNVFDIQKAIERLREKDMIK